MRYSGCTMAQLNFPKREEEILEFWEKEKVFEKSLEKPAPKGDFVFYDGPPFATGLPHYGHILASTIKDVIPRYKTMQGFYVRRRWGWDCHGLPIENIVEQQMGISGKKQIEEKGIEFFNKTCRDNVLTFVSEWKKMVRRIGRWVEFDNAYKTMDPTFMESVWWALKSLWDKNLIYEGRKVLLYCPRCETPISNFEVAMDNSYDEIDDLSTTVKFKITDKAYFEKHPGEDPTYLLAWTTTPWSLFSTTGLAIGPDFIYAVVRYENAYYFLAKDRVDAVFNGLGAYEVVRTVSGRELDGISYEHLVDYYLSQVRRNKNVYRTHLTDYVSTEEGTGVVTINPAYGDIDYEAGLRFKLPIILDVSLKGRFEDIVKDFAGQEAMQSNEKIAAFLKNQGTLLRADMVRHSYPFCWRCDTKLFYRAIPAWFVNIKKVKKKLLKANEKINWAPQHLKEGRFKKGIEGAPDWNISRNRYWATPLPFWRCGGCDNVICVGSLKELQEQALNYDEVYKSRNINEVDLHRPYIDAIKLKCSKCGGTMARIFEVVDCWVESGSMPYAEFHYPFENVELFKKRYPADFVAEYIAQTRAWFYVMHVLGVTLFKKAPFKNVVTTGTILAATGDKLSKSKRNFPDPWEVIGKYGIDSLRLHLMASPVMQADNLFFVEREVDGIYKKVVLLTLNVLSFYKMYDQGLGTIEEDEFSLKPYSLNSKHVLDKWIVARLHETISGMTDGLERYDVVKAGRFIPGFVDDLSTWYLRRSRDRFKSIKKSERQAALRTTHYVLHTFSQLIAPFMPFLAEHIWGELRIKDQELSSVHLSEWPKAKKARIDAKLLGQMQITRKIVELGHAARAEAKIKVRQPLAELRIMNKGSSLAGELLKLIAEEGNVKAAEIVPDLVAGQGWIVKEDSGLKVALNTTITPELQKEGFMRELTRHINEVRKIVGLTPKDTVQVILTVPDPMFISVVKEFQKQLRKAVIASSVKIVDTPQESELSHEIELENHQKIWVGINRL